MICQFCEGGLDISRRPVRICTFCDGAGRVGWTER